jgi:hypothetical protein
MKSTSVRGSIQPCAKFWFWRRNLLGWWTSQLETQRKNAARNVTALHGICNAFCLPVCPSHTGFGVHAQMTHAIEWHGPKAIDFTRGDRHGKLVELQIVSLTRPLELFLERDLHNNPSTKYSGHEQRSTPPSP